MKVRKKAAKTRPVFALKCDPRKPAIQPMVWYGMVMKLP